MKYMMLIYEDEADFAERVGDKAAFEAYMAPWFKYSQDLAQAGVAAGGDPLEPSHTATVVKVRDGKRIVQDGPYMTAKEQLGGFYIFDVPNLDEAIKWAEKCPATTKGAVELRPIWNLQLPE